MNNVVEFNSHKLDVITYNNEYCFQSQQIVDALEMDSRQQLNNIYRRHKSEFDGFSYLPKSGRPRLFNREGAWLIGMFARTPKAAEFRKWVLKVLGAVADSANNAPTGKAVTVSEHTRALPSGKKEIVLSEKAREEIGGIVKSVVNKALEERSSAQRDLFRVSGEIISMPAPVYKAIHTGLLALDPVMNNLHKVITGACRRAIREELASYLARVAE